MDRREHQEKLEYMRNNHSKQVKAYMGWIPWQDGHRVGDAGAYRVPDDIFCPSDSQIAAIKGNEIIRNMMRVV